MSQLRCRSGQAALLRRFPDNMIVWVADPERKDAYRSSPTPWLLVYKKYSDKKKHDTLVLNSSPTGDPGQKDAEALGYIPLPPAVVERVRLPSSA